MIEKVLKERVREKKRGKNQLETPFSAPQFPPLSKLCDTNKNTKRKDPKI